MWCQPSVVVFLTANLTPKTAPCITSAIKSLHALVPDAVCSGHRVCHVKQVSYSCFVPVAQGACLVCRKCWVLVCLILRCVTNRVISATLVITISIFLMFMAVIVHCKVVFSTSGITHPCSFSLRVWRYSNHDLWPRTWGVWYRVISVINDAFLS